MTLSILAVDDNHIEQKLLRARIALIGAQGSVVGNVESALELLKWTRFDLVLTDLRMPGGGGLALLRKMRQQGFMQPVVAVTACVLSADRERCLAEGMAGFQAKPYRQADFEEMVDCYGREAKTPQQTPGRLLPFASGFQLPA